MGYANNSTIFKMACTCRTTTHTRSIIAVVASFRTNFQLKAWISSVNCFRYPIPALSYRNIVFGLTSYYTIAAANTFSRINRHCISHDFTSFPTLTESSLLIYGFPFFISSSVGFSVRNVTKFPLIPVPPITGSIITFVISF